MCQLNLPEFQFFDEGKMMIHVLRRLAQNARLLHSEMSNLQRAAEVLEGMAALLGPHSTRGTEGGQLKKTSVFGSQFRFGSWGPLGRNSAEPHAAMIDSQEQEREQEADVSYQLRRQQLKYLGRLLEHVRGATGEVALPVPCLLQRIACA